MNDRTPRQIRSVAARYVGDWFADQSLFSPDRSERVQRVGLQPFWGRWVSETSVRVLVSRRPL
jgi:hypothetical protein